ncbi:hypothetical protein [Siminovitchia terrae]|uniref:hypothetical protein n=1 Tax=Siminovitchia terrae TaxID=1914933 RepID=UPI0028AD28FB|nr:hypothetical protein [Siminovitchia terrae]
MSEWKRIPTHDILGQRIKVGEKAILFSTHGVSFEGTVVQRGGKRWLEIDKGVWIGGIGNHFMIKG